MLAAQWHVGQVFFALLWFALFVVWVWLLVAVFIDVFRSPDLSGWAKALWVLFLVVVPYLGVFVYLVARGGRMAAINVRYGIPMRDAPAPRAVLTHEQVEAIDQLNAARDQQLIDADEYRARREAILG